MEKSSSTSVNGAAAALAEVDTAAWSQRFDLLSDPTRLEIVLVLHRAPGINVGDLAAMVGKRVNRKLLPHKHSACCVA